MSHLSPIHSTLRQSLSRSNFTRRTLINLLVVMACMAGMTQARANTITVNNTTDSLITNGTCSIREAIINANNDAATWPDCAAGSGVDTINLPAGTITLTIANTPSSFSAEELSLKGDLDITSSLIINGNAAGTVIDGGAIDRIFDINPDLDLDPGTPSITVAISTLTITNGYQNQSGAVRVQANATVTMDNCTVSNSTSWADDGGGIFVFTGGTLTMTNCTVSGNHALLLAGGVRNDGTMTMMSCIVTDSTSSFTNLITGVYNGGTMTLGNTIIAGNAGVDSPNLVGIVTSLGYNIIGSLGTAGFNPIPVPGPGDQVGVSDASIQLGPLQNNGGPTPTHALAAGSIAIDKGNSFALTTDQRGEVRPCDQAAIANAAGGDGADVGPFEVQGACASPNSPPDAVDDSVMIVEDSGANTISVLANDTDPDLDTLTVTVVTQGVHGSVAIGGGGANVTYTPAANYFGSDSFTYTISDGNSHTDSATVNVTVTNVEDPPDANDDSKTILEDSGANTISVLANDTDVDLDTLSVTAVTQGAHGTVAITGGGTTVSYTSAADFFGSDTFTYTINDGNGGTDTATVHVTVTNVNDAPIAAGESYSTNSNTPLNVSPPGVLGNDTDVDGDTLTAQLVSGPSHAATFALNGNGSFNYSPTLNYAGPDSFTYMAFDGTVYSNTVTVNINVIDTVPPTLTASVTDSMLWPPNHDLENVGPSISASDNSGGPVTIQIAVFSDDDDLAPGSGNFSPDAKNIAPGTLRLRSERRGSGDGRVYLIVVTATDPSNNVSHVCVTVVVPKSQSQSSKDAVNAEAAAAKAYCESHGGTPPPGYFVVGDGPVVGPKQ